jgi:hypothetical protein
MVRINGKFQVVVQDLDTQQTFITKLAAEMKTLPMYLYFKDGIPDITALHDKDTNIEVEDLLTTIRTTDVSESNLVSFLKELQTKIANNKLYKPNFVFDILTPVIAYNKNLSNIPDDFQQTYSLLYEEVLKKDKTFEVKQSIYDIWEKRKDTISQITNAIKQNDMKVKSLMKVYKKFYDVEEGVNYTDFELERVNFEFSIDIINMSIMEIFNQIQLDPTVPFASINNTFKILKDFIPSEDWSVYLETAIVFKVLQKANIADYTYEDFSDAVLAILNGPEGDIVSVGMTLETSAGYLSREKLIERLLEIIKGVGKITIKNIKEQYVNGVFYIPNRTMNKNVLADLVMNNPIFSSLLATDESDKATKKKGNSLYLYFNHPLTGNMTINITEKVSVKGDIFLRGKNIKKDFPYGSTYVRVKVTSAKNIASVILFQNILSKLFVVYDQEYVDVVKFYKTFIPNFAEKSDKTVYVPPPNLKLKDIAPEVFVKGYPPKCPHQPTVIEDDEVETAVSEGKVVMRYPKDSNEGFAQRNYVCNHKLAIYPGLRNNQLGNKDIVPYLPCCYTKSHEDKKGSIYRHYYYGEELRTKMNVGQQDLIITNKFVPKDKYGTLPDDITKLFEVLDPQDGYMFVRKGVDDNKSSFLNCVMEGMYEETNILQYQDKDEREAILYDTREKMATSGYAVCSKQEMYDFTISEIISSIKNPDVLFDPKLFTGMLEEYFNCNIFVFNRNNNRDGQLVLPRHIQAYYKTKRRTKSIFIYEHSGSSSDHSEYPRCELIVRWKIGGGGEEDVTYYFPYDSTVSRGVQSVYNDLNKSYALSKEILQTEFPIKNSNLKLINQNIDSYGKCRMLNFKYKNQLGSMLISPIQPLPIPENTSSKVPTKLKLETAIKLASELKIIISGQSVVRGFVKELYGILGNVNLSIPIEDIVPNESIPTLDKGISYMESTESVVGSYNKYKKLSRYISEYVFWLFSKYMKSKSKTDIELDDIKGFFDTNVKIIKDFEYGNVDKSFSMTSGVMDGNKLVLKSEDTLKRLVYVLRVYVRRFRNKILQYYAKKVIENYYVDVTDFDQYQFQVVLQGDNSVKKWIHEMKRKYILLESVQISLTGPYFFKNTLVDDNIYLAQNTDDIRKCISIFQTWKKDKFNPGDSLIDIKELSVTTGFKLYRYVSSNDIKAYKIGIKTSDLSPKVLGYKINDQSYYTILLPL